MKADVKGCSTCQAGKESYESFYSTIKKCDLVQYDYRHTDGELFTCVAISLDSARNKKEQWLTRKQKTVLGMFLPELSLDDLREEKADLKKDLACKEAYEKGEITYSELIRETLFAETPKEQLIDAIEKITEEMAARVLDVLKKEVGKNKTSDNGKV